MQNRNTLFIGKVLLNYASLESTNASALELLSKSNPSEGTVISAYEQTIGRGQIGSSWESEAGKNLTLSLILYPKFIPVRHQFILNQAIALGVRDTVAAFVDSEVTVKWPNDIYIRGHKTAGILIQNQLLGSNLQACVVGIGLNVNQKIFSPALSNPTSLLLNVTSTLLDLGSVQEELFIQLEQRYLQLRGGQEAKIQGEYLQYMYRYGTLADYERADGTRFRGTIAGLTETGKLLVRHEHGTEAFEIKGIKFLA
ncbi:MAG: biotin--[acetyl-CoA-carboxylase] ligase [Saprospiraceae bacterium]|nr:MAG: biotin--[acetyl-CoA-carboxylase] ligase [Saprospiraceae bacterium]